MSGSSNEGNLKSQLSELQKRLSDATFHSPAKSSSNSTAGHERKSLSNLMSKREKRASLPVFENNKTLATPSKSGGKDMDFVVGLSENLLLECRKLQAENQKKSQKLKSLEEEYHKVKSAYTSTSARLNELSVNEEKTKESNWELQAKLQQFTEEMKALQTNYKKSQSELHKQIELSTDMRGEIEAIKINKKSLEKELSANESTKVGNVQELRTHIDELNDQNTKLNDEIDELRYQLEESKNGLVEKKLTAIPSLKPDDDYSSGEEYNEPPISPVKNIAINNTALESETLRSSLQNAHQTIAKLRSQILKLRSHEITNAQTPPPSAISKKGSSKKVKDSNRSLLASSKRGSVLVHDDTMDDVDWQNFEGDSTTSVDQSPTRKGSQRPLSTVGPLIEDSNSEDENDVLETVPLSSELQTVTEKQVNEYAKRNNLVLIGSEDYNKLKKNDPESKIAVQTLEQKVTSLEIEHSKYQKEAAHYKNELEKALETLQKDKIAIQKLDTQISNPTESYILEKAPSLKLKVLRDTDFTFMNKELDGLKKNIANPSDEFIHSKAASKNLKVIKGSDHDSLLSELESLKKSHSDQAALLEKKEDEVKVLSEKVSNPSAEFLEEKASNHGLKILNSQTLEDLNGSIASLKERLQISSGRIELLESEIENPSHSYLTEKSTKQGLTIIPTLQHDDLLKKSNRSVYELAQQSDHVVLTKDEHKKLVKSAKSPSIGTITKSAKAQGQTVIPEAQYDSLVSLANKPIEKSAKEQGLKLLKEDEYSSLFSKAESPSIEHIEKSARSHGFLVVPESEHSNLLSRASKTVEVLAKENGLSLLPEKEHEELKRKLKSPTIEELSTAAKSHKQLLVSENDYTELNKNASKTLEQHANEKNAIAIDKAEYEALQRKLTSPTIEELKSNAQSVDHVILSAQDHEELVNRSTKTAHDLAKESDSVVIPESQYNELISNTESPSVEYLANKAAVAGHKIISNVEHEKLLAAAKKPIEKLAEEKGLHLLTREEHDQLSNPSEITISKKAEAYGLKTISKEKHEQLVNNSEAPSLEHVISKAKLHNYKAVPANEYDELTQNSKAPSKEFLNSRAQNLGYVVVSQKEYNALREESAALKRNLTDKKLLADKVSADGNVVLKKQDYDELLASSTRSIEDVAKAQNKIVLNNDSYEELIKPSKEKIAHHARELDLAVIPKEEHATLVRTVEAPTLDHLSSKASIHDHVVIPQERYNELKTTFDNPTQTFLSDRAKAFDSVVVKSREHEQLKEQASKDLSTVAQEQGKLVIDKTEYEDLKTPSRESIISAASAIGSVVVGREDFETLKQSHEKPDITFLKSKAADLSYILLPKKEYNDLKSTSAKPSIQFLRKKAQEQNLIIVPSREFESIKQRSEKSVQDLAKEQNLVLVEQAAYENLVSPTQQDLNEKATKKGFVLLNKDEHAKLANPTKDVLKSHAESQGLILSDKDYFEQIGSRAKKSLDTLAAEQDKVLLSNEEYNKLKHPSTKEIEDLATESGLIAITNDEHESLIHPSHLVLNVQAEKAGFKLLTKDEYSALQERASKDIQDLAKDKGLVILSEDQHEQLKNPDASTVVAHAAKFGLQTLSSDQHNALLRPSKETLTAHANNHGLKLVPENSKVISDSSEQGVEELKRNLCEISKINPVAVIEATKNLGYIPIPIHEYDSFADSNKNLPITATDIYENAKNFDLIVLPAHDYNKLVEKDTGKENITPEQLEILAHQWNLKLTPLDDKFDGVGSQVSAKTSIPLSVQNNESGSDLSIISGEGDFEDALDRAPSTNSTIKDASEEATLINLKTQARKLGYSLVEDKLFNDKAELLKENEGILDVGKKDVKTDYLQLSEEEIKESAQKFGLIVLDQKEYDSLILTAKFDDNTLREASKELGLVTLNYSEYNELVERHRKNSTSEMEDIAATAEKNNLVVLDHTQYEALKDKAEKCKTEEGVAAIASELGLSVTSSESTGARTNSIEAASISKDKLVEQCTKQGLVAIPLEERNKLRSKDSVSDFKFSPNEISLLASKAGMNVISSEEYKALKQQGTSSREISTQPTELSKLDLERNAKTHGLLLIPENSFVATNISRVPDVENVVVLPVSYYNKLTKSESLNLDKISNDELQAQAKRRGFQIVHDEIGASRETPGMKRSDTMSSIGSLTSRKSLAEAAASAAYHDFDFHSPHKGSISRSQSFSRSGSRSNSISHAHRAPSIDGGISLMTNADLSEPTIVPALTQTVIGEFLFKYYRRLGPLSSLSESRHERYFWIHPYTMTLYWSSTNPVISNPANHKTRAAAIMSVESVEDNNPLPAGLYHKSIIVHTQTRSIKFTCPTRQRHNIWYNSLRFLIQRNMDGIDLNEDLLKDSPQKAPQSAAPRKKK